MVFLHRPATTARAWLALALIAALLLAILSGLVYTVATVLSGGKPTRASVGSHSETTPPAAEPSTVQLQDALAAKAMTQLPASAAFPQPLAQTTSGPPIRLPAATSTSGLVPTGFPRTPQGALAQLAAIDVRALRDLAAAQVAQVHQWATVPDAVPLREWTPFVAASAALAASGLADGSAALESTFTPVAGQIKGTVGADFVVACVLGEWQVTYRATSRAGAADCQRLVWSRGRWRIGAGDQPAYAPSAWPGSADAVRAGWRGLTDA